MRAGSGHPPQHLEAGGFLLRRATAADDALISAAVAANLERLARYMAWATPESATLEHKRERLPKVTQEWAEQVSFQYLAVDENGSLLGVFGLERRIGPGALEIGYWLDSAATGRGVATAGAGVLTRIALALPGIERVEIHVDESNRASWRIPQRLRYRLDRVVKAPIRAPGQTGRQQIWVYP